MNPRIQQLEDVLDAILRGIQEVLQNGEIIPDELQAMLAQEINLLTQEIDALYAQQELPGAQPPTPPTQPPIEPTMPSSNVEGFSYDPRNNRLYVRFLGQHPNRFGPVYQYENVPPEIFNVFRQGAVPARTNGRNRWGRWWKGKVPSIGASLYTLIKTQGYPYQRVA